MFNYTFIILNKSNNKLLFNCLDSIYEFIKCTNNFTIFIGDTGSSPDEINEILDYIENTKRNIQLITFDKYNFAINNNIIVEGYCNKEREVLIFCNNDIQLKSDIIAEFEQIFSKNDKVGTIGCQLLFGDKRIQHAGIEIGTRGRQFYITHRGLGQFNISEYNDTIEVIGNTAALLAIKKDVFREIGGFPENYIECFEDVELNIKCILAGYTNIYCGKAKAFHFESQTRNYNINKNANMSIDFRECLIPLMQNFLKNPDHLKKYLNIHE